MKYFQPRSVSDAVELAQTADATFLAGGTDLVLHMQTGKAQPVTIIDRMKSRMSSLIVMPYLPTIRSPGPCVVSERLKPC